MTTYRLSALSFAPFAMVSLLAGDALADRHAVFNLVDNRPLAHLQRRGGLYIDAGGAGFAKYVHFSRPIAVWKLRQTEDGKRVAVPMAAVSIEVPLTAAEAQGKVIHLGLKTVASTVRVTSQGKQSAAVPLKAGWQVVSVPLPDGALAAGENTIQLNFANYGKFGGNKAAAAVEFIQVGGTAPGQADAPLKGAELRLPPGGGMSYFAWLPEGGAIAANGDGHGCKVTAQIDGNAPAELKLDGTPLDFTTLGAKANRFARLSLAASGGCDAATLKRAEIQGAGATPQLAAKNPPKNIILWVSDSTRADKFRIYNPKTRVETPFFDELAKRATVFKVAYVQGNESRVSHASLFSGVYAGVHQMIPEKAKLNSDFVIIPEAVRPSGRWTAGVMGNGYIDKFWGFGDGWDFLRNHIHEGGGLKGEELLAEAKKLMAQKNDKPHFIYVGSIDAHVSWRAHEPWLSKYDPQPYSGPFVKACLDPDLDKIIGGKMKISDRDRVRVQALYDSDISYTDSVIRQLFDDLKKRGHDNDTMVIFTADHGEEMWDHGKIGHGQSLHEELVHVPLVVYYPPYFPAGKVVEEGVDVMDILPTLTDALGVATPDAIQGESLIPVAQGVNGGYPRPAVASQYELAHTMRLGAFKLWVGGSGQIELYDMPNDPHEDKNLWTSRPTERRALTDAMGTWMAFRNQWKKRKWGVASNLSGGFAAEMEK